MWHDFLYLHDPSSVTMPSPSALFCLSNAFKSRTLEKKHQKSNQSLCVQSHSALAVPARLHQSWETLKETCISFLFQVIKHFLGRDRRKQSSVQNLQLYWSMDGSWWTGSSSKDKGASIRQLDNLTCWTCTLPPFRMEIPSLRVHVTMGPRRPAEA